MYKLIGFFILQCATTLIVADSESIRHHPSWLVHIEVHSTLHPSNFSSTTPLLSNHTSFPTATPTKSTENVQQQWELMLEIAMPISVVLIALLLIFLICFIKKRKRKRQQERELLPDYAYDHSEVDSLDTLGHFSHSDSIEGLLTVGLVKEQKPILAINNAEDNNSASTKFDNKSIAV